MADVYEHIHVFPAHIVAVDSEELRGGEDLERSFFSAVERPIVQLLPSSEGRLDPGDHVLDREELKPIHFLAIPQLLVDRLVVERHTGLVLPEVQVVTHAFFPAG